MNIPLDEGYRLSSDKFQWKIQKLNGKKWKSLSFHSSAEAAVNYHAHGRVRAIKAETLVDALDEIENVVATLTDALEVDFDIKRR